MVQYYGEQQPLLSSGDVGKKTSRRKHVMIFVTTVIAVVLLTVLSKNIRYDRKENKFDEDDRDKFDEDVRDPAYGINYADFDEGEYDVAYVNLMRHAEKDFSDPANEHLFDLGYDRADYYARCMAPSSKHHTESFPKPVGSLLAQLNATIDPPYKGNYGTSQRSYETLEPLSQVLGIPVHLPCTMTDMDCFVNTVLQDLIRPNETVLVSWEHKLFPKLLELLLTQHVDDDDADGGATLNPKPIMEMVPDGPDLLKMHYKKWPEKCDAQSWENPRVIKEEKIAQGKLAFPFHSACFDRVWQIKYIVRRKKRTNTTYAAQDWIPINVRSINNGYGGNSTSPCEEGLKPIPFL